MESKDSASLTARAIRFDPSTRMAVVQRLVVEPPEDHQVSLEIERVLLAAESSIAPRQTSPFVPGGAVAGRVAFAGRAAQHRPGTRVVSFARSGACAERVRLPDGAVFELDDSVSADHAVIALVPGLRAWLAVTEVIARGSEAVAILGASGSTGRLLGHLASLHGLEAHAVSTSPDGDNELAGLFSSVQVADPRAPESFVEALERSGAEAVVSCLRDEALLQQLHGRLEDRTWFAFSEAARPEANPGWHIIDIVRRAGENIDEIALQFDVVAALLANGEVSVPIRHLSFDDVAGRIEPRVDEGRGASILDPTR